MKDSTKKLIAEAQAAFADHEIILDKPDRWRIAKKYPDGAICLDHLAEIISIRGGLFVGGDLSPVVFQYFDSQYPIAQVIWIGGVKTDVDYICEKASIGFGTDELVWVYDADEAVLDLQWHRNQYDSEDVHEKFYQSVIDGVIDATEDGDESLCREVLQQIPDSWEWNIGRIPSTRVIYAWQACRKLMRLLQVTKEKDPICI